MTNKNRPKPTVISTDPSKNIGMAIDDVNKGVTSQEIEEIVNKNDYVDNNFIDDFYNVYVRWAYSNYDKGGVPEIMQKMYVDILRDKDLEYIKANLIKYIEMVRGI